MALFGRKNLPLCIRVVLYPTLLQETQISCAVFLPPAFYIDWGSVPAGMALRRFPKLRAFRVPTRVLTQGGHWRVE